MANALATILDPANPEIAQYRTQAPELLAVAQALEITDDAGLAVAAEHTKLATAAVKGIKALFKPAKAALDEAKRQVGGLEQALLQGFEEADRVCRAKVIVYRTEQRRRAEEEARRAREAERKRREDAQLEQALRLERLARVTGEPHYDKAAELVLNQPIREAPVTAAVPKVPGLTDRETVGVTVVDLRGLVAAVAAGTVDAQALLPNVKWLRGEAAQRGDALRDGDELCPGVVVTRTPGLAVRTR